MASDVDDRLSLRWRADELRGTLPRRGAPHAVDAYVDTAFGLLVVSVAGIAVPAATTQLMITAGLAGWAFPALVATLFLLGVSAMGLNLLTRIVRHGLESWTGVTPWRFVLTPTHLVFSGAETTNAWVPGASRFLVGLPFGPRRLLLALDDIESIDAAPPGLQIELTSGGAVFLDVDPDVSTGDLDVLCTFVRERIAVARTAAEGRAVTAAEAREAFGPLPQLARSVRTYSKSTG